MGFQQSAVLQADGMKLDSGLHCGDLFGYHFKAIRSGMLQKLIAELEAANLNEAGVILHVLGNGHLPPGNALFDKDGFQGCPHCVNTGSETRWPPTHDDQIIKIIC
ncbi:MAG: hypothetical protein ACD_75C00006G0005 [uncultured bacterium]|nr:MAG: hypothetical protein ACD_75C00006G0005 [uncultured bacterium]